MVVTALIFFVILSILVFVHELGHFLVARFVGVKVEEFGLGLPPRIAGKKVNGTIYSLNWLPIGGFVKLAGEDEESETLKVKSEKLKEYFFARTKKERAAILLAGVTMNFLLALGITMGLLVHGVMEPSGRVHVERVLTGSPAEAAGIREKDIIAKFKCQNSNVKCEEQNIIVPKDLIDRVKAHAGETISLTILRDDKAITKVLVPRKNFPKGEGPMGVAVSDLEKRTYGWKDAPGRALVITLTRARDMVVGVFSLVGKALRLQSLQSDVAGPIGIAQYTGQAVKYGWQAVLEFMSILSLNLAVLNILPIPALDGGRLAFVFLEKFLGRRVRPAFERSAHQVGMIVLFALILLISLGDIARLARGGG